MDTAVKRWAGESAREFLVPKVELMMRKYKRSGENIDYLDFGCGTGEFLTIVNEQRPSWNIEGCDISSGMLEEGRKRWPFLNENGRLWQCGGGAFPVGKYDLITAVCVFHHIPPSELENWVKTLKAALRPGGSFILIEHNPWNPGTRWIVAHTKIDENATLVSERKARRLFTGCGMRVRGIYDFMYVPPRWKLATRMARMFEALPLGGQYLLEAINPG